MERKAALVTGSAKRIGRSIVEMLVQQGWSVAVHYNNSQKEAKALTESLIKKGAIACAVKCDLSNQSEIRKLLSECTKKIGPISLLINNASFFEYDNFETFESELWERTLSINLTAPVKLSRYFRDQLPQGENGCIINLLDQKVFNLNPDFFSYTISKQGLEVATRTLALALAPNIRVCGIAPGITLISGKQSEENFSNAHKKALLGKSSEVSNIVDAVQYLINAKATTGITLTVDGGQHLFPTKRDVQFET